MAEGENPTRRYKWFRPRQAAAGSATDTSTGGDEVAISLFNNSTGPYFLVVRSIDMQSSASPAQVVLINAPGQIGNQDFTVSTIPILMDQAQPPGLIIITRAYDFVGAQFGYQFNGVSNEHMWWQYDFPVAVIPPNWSLVALDQTGATTLRVSFMYEFLFADELDFAW